MKNELKHTLEVLRALLSLLGRQRGADSSCKGAHQRSADQGIVCSEALTAAVKQHTSEALTKESFTFNWFTFMS
jgi:hypothetical protein